MLNAPGRPPSDTAAHSSSEQTEPIPASWIGTVQPTSSVIGVVVTACPYFPGRVELAEFAASGAATSARTAVEAEVSSRCLTGGGAEA